MAELGEGFMRLADVKDSLVSFFFAFFLIFFLINNKQAKSLSQIFVIVTLHLSGSETIYLHSHSQKVYH